MAAPLLFLAALTVHAVPSETAGAGGEGLRAAPARSFVIEGQRWRGEADAATGALRWAKGAGIPWMPGRGNRLRGEVPADPLPLLAAQAEKLVGVNLKLLGLTGFNLHLDDVRSHGFGAPPYLYVLFFRVLALGLPVQGARVTFVVNNGNLVTLTVVAPPTPPVRVVPVLALPSAQGLAAGELARNGQIREPEFRRAALAWRYSGGSWALVWEGLVRDRSTGILSQVTTSAESGRVLEVRSLRADGQVTGGVRPRGRAEAPTLMPLRGATISDGANIEATDAAGRFSLSGASLSATLAGPYATVIDGCGGDTIPADTAGALFGATLRTDCAPGVGSAPGDTSAARTTSWHVNRIRDLYRAYDTQSSWLDTPAPVWTNVMSECVNYFDGENIFLNWSGGSTICANAGDGGEEVDHEWGARLPVENLGVPGGRGDSRGVRERDVTPSVSQPLHRRRFLG